MKVSDFVNRLPVSEADKKRMLELAEQYGLELTKHSGLAFAEWLLARPRIARRPLLAKLLYKLLG